MRDAALQFVLIPVLLAVASSAAVHAEEVGSAGPEYDKEMLALAWDSGCFNCHDLDQTVRGPAWRDVAARYRDDPQAFEVLRQRVRDGSGGNWGDDRMSPNRRVAMEDIDRLLRWLLALEPDGEDDRPGDVATEPAQKDTNER